MDTIERRITLYLSALKLPRDRASAIREKVLQRFKSSDGKISNQAFAPVMEHLRQVLASEKIDAESLFIPSIEKATVYPELRRVSMVYREPGTADLREVESKLKAEAAKNSLIPSWAKAALNRRIVMILSTFFITVWGIYSTYTVLEDKGMTFLEWMIIATFSVLFAWLTVNFMTAFVGFFRLCRNVDLYKASNALRVSPETISPDSPTAVIVPVYNEDVAAVFASIKAMILSVRQTKNAESFRFFVLSDTANMDKAVEEEIAWIQACDELEAHGKLFYRRRRNRIDKKSGNVADFCRRWGSDFKYMIVLDSDSLMSGNAMADMVRIMEARPDVGLLQSIPTGVNQTSLLARIQQFISHLYGPLFLAGLHYWQLGDAAFWGHNAVIRMEPFLKFCALPKLSGRPPFGGGILSHDFVEAALMRRAGYGIWLYYDCSESYEQFPSNLLTEMERDKRWCLGNMQHLRFLFMKGISLGHRGLFLNGNMFYFSSFLWFLLIIFFTTRSILSYIFDVSYFPETKTMMPAWPDSHKELSWSLFAVTLVFLIAPKVLSIIHAVAIKKAAREYGGMLHLSLSVVIETLVSLLLAPLRMISHTLSILQIFFGKLIGWEVKARNADIAFGDAFAVFGGVAIVAMIWAFVVAYFDTTLFMWLFPILGPLACAVPLCYVTGQSSVGLLFRKWGLFMIPEELNEPKELSDMNRFYEKQRELSEKTPFVTIDGFRRVVIDPHVNVIHRKLLGHEKHFAEGIEKDREKLFDRVIQEGPSSISAEEKKILMTDSAGLARLHSRVWALSESELFDHWCPVG